MNETTDMTVRRLLLRPNEVARMLAIGRTTAYELIRTGQLPGIVHIGGIRRVSAEALHRWITEQCEPEQGGTGPAEAEDAAAPARGLPGPRRFGTIRPDGATWDREARHRGARR